MGGVTKDSYDRAHQHLVQPAGMRPDQLAAEVRGADISLRRDRPLPDRPKRPCSNCRRPFKPTIRRRMLCPRCFAGKGDTAA